jgi:hypothetical protein
MMEHVLFGNTVGHLASSEEKTNEERGHVALVQLLCTGQRHGGSQTNRPWRDIWYVSFVNLSKGRILGRESDERGGGERHYGLPQQRRGNCQVSREEQALPH